MRELAGIARIAESVPAAVELTLPAVDDGERASERIGDDPYDDNAAPMLVIAPGR